MEEKEKNTENFDTDGSIAENNDSKSSTKSPFKLWFENFIYHYKWHTIVAIILIITISICSFQMCSKSSFDAYVLYAGSKNVSKIADSGDVSEYVTLSTSIKRAVEDFDGDGNVSLSLDTLYMLSDEQIAEIEKELEEKNEEEKEDFTLSYSQLAENNNVFRDRMLYSEYYVCLLSLDLYEAYKEVDGAMRFVALDKYVESGSSVKYVEGSKNTAVYLNSTGFSSLPGVSVLPEDTVIVLRARSEISAHFSRKDNAKIYERSEKVVEKILNYEG